MNIGSNALTYFSFKPQPSSGSYKCWKKKHVGALKWIIVQVFGNELVCIRHLHELCILSNIEKTGWGSCKENF